MAVECQVIEDQRQVRRKDGWTTGGRIENGRSGSTKGQTWRTEEQIVTQSHQESDRDVNHQSCHVTYTLEGWFTGSLQKYIYLLSF